MATSDNRLLKLTTEGRSFSNLGLQIEVAPTITLSPLAQLHVDIGFRPLLVGASESQLQLTCQELGTYTYRLLLDGHPPPPIPPVSFSTDLGTVQTQVSQPLPSRSVCLPPELFRTPDLIAWDVRQTCADLDQM